MLTMTIKCFISNLSVLTKITKILNFNHKFQLKYADSLD